MNYQGRFDRLRKRLELEGGDALFLSDPINLYYYTGLDLSTGKLLIDQESAILLVDGRYIEAAQAAKGPCQAELVREESLDSYLKKHRGVRTLLFDSQLVSFDLYQKLALSRVELRPLPGLLMELRAVKEAEEIELLRAAAALGSRGYDFVASLLKEGVIELELARELEIFWLRQGGEKLAFDPIIAFDANSSMPHYRSGTAQMAQGGLALFDIGVQLGHYQSDMTRIRTLGTAHPKLEKIYGVVRAAFEAAAALCRPGATAGELDRAAREVIATAGYGDFFSHGLGHGVGLEVHELPVLKSPSPYGDRRIEAGMVVTIEPGIYLPKIGGVRLEDTFVVTPTGAESLTQRPL